MRTLEELFKKDLTNEQKKVLLAAMSERWGIAEVNTRKALYKVKFKDFEEDLAYLHTYHAIGLDHKKGFFVDLDRLKEIKTIGLPIPKLYGLSV